MRKFLTSKIGLAILIIAASLALFIPLISQVFLTPITKGLAESLLKSQVHIGNAELHLLSGSIIVNNTKVYHPTRKEDVYMKADQIAVTVRPLAFLFRKKGSVAISFDEPHMTYQTDRHGKWELSNEVPLFRRGKGEKRLPVNIDKIVIEDGSVTYIDNKFGKSGVTTKITDVDLEVNDVRLPTEKGELPAEFDMDLRINNSGKLSMSGKADFLSPKISFDADIKLKGLNIVPFSPYFQKRSIPVHIVKGTAAMTSQAHCKNDYLKAPAQVSLSNFVIKPKGKLLGGLPAQAIVDGLKERDGELKLNMMIEGNINNPRFILANNLPRAFAAAVTKGLSQDIGNEVREAMEKTGSGIKKGLDEGVNKLKGLFR